VGTILSQDGLYLIKPVYIEVHGDGCIFARAWEGGRGSVLLGKYPDRERAEDVLREIFQTEYYEMPLE
jgi:hypothetical protein